LAALSDARQRLEQREALATAGLVTAEEVDELRTEVHVRELALLGAEEEHLIAVLERDRSWTMLARLEIAAPAGGVVTARPLSPGELVSRSGMSTLLEISQLHPLLIDVHVPIDSWSSIEVGDEAEVEVLAPGIAMRTATVSYVSPIADAGSETFLVRLELPNPDHALPAGLRARVHLTE
ncbi:MAG: efflux RND transporter periplasmic adaptor subunit, partial [Planctomycetota bacterium]|nr:efflux RND transporter periplasmic adaptor subunit [Planctomycetota bacterium]